MPQKIYQVDAFTDHAFGGNPAAVCPLDSWLDEPTMQQIAMENNLSETAFFVPVDGHFEIRWFTPVAEIDLCGHATLASAHVILNHLNANQKEIIFQYGGGTLTVQQNTDGLLSMIFPANPPQPVPVPDGLEHALGNTPGEVLKARDFIIVFDKEQDIRELEPDLNKLKDYDVTGFVVTAPGDEVDFVSRVFAPRMGIDEDPVTGSTHTEIIPYWATKLKKSNMKALQLSKRGGKIYCENHGDHVVIAGHAVTYLVGEIYF